MKFRIGTTFRSSSFSEAPTLARQYGYDTFQCFLGPAEMVYCPSKSTETLVKFKNDLRKNHVTCVIHGSYTINLCHPTLSVKGARSIRALIQLLDQAVVIGKRCLGIIIHMGKNVKDLGFTTEQALDMYATNLEYICERSKSRIILETGAGQGTEVGYKLEDLGYIYNKLSNKTKKRIHFCIDSCHIWSAGYDISTKNQVKQYFDDFDRIVGGKITVIHFNNSMTDLGSRVDRHADLLHGKIPDEGIKAISQYAKDNNLALITETPHIKTNAKNELEIILNMLN